MRKVATCILAAASSCAALMAAPPARADSCRGDLYCDGRRSQPPKPPDCNQGGIIVCSAGDVLIKDLP